VHLDNEALCHLNLCFRAVPPWSVADAPGVDVSADSMTAMFATNCNVVTIPVALLRDRNKAASMAPSCTFSYVISNVFDAHYRVLKLIPSHRPPPLVNVLPSSVPNFPNPSLGVSVKKLAK